MVNFVYIFYVLVAVIDSILGAVDAYPATDFRSHLIITPRFLNRRQKRHVTSTTNEARHGLVEHLSVEVPISSSHQFVLDLTLNRQLIPKNFFRRTQQNGRGIVDRSQEVELCHYNGKIRGKADSWAALTSCGPQELTGVFYDGNDLHYIERRNETGSEHVLYRHADLLETNKTCGYDGDAAEPFHVPVHRKKRSATSEVRGPYNSNRDSKYVELVLVVDNREYKEFGENGAKVERHCKTIANIINGLYAQLNIFVALVGIVIWTEHDEISFSENGDTTLTNFLHYRREKLVKEHPNDNAQLLTKLNFENGVVGKALKGPICTYEFSGGVNTDHSTVVGLVATTVAHEMGHNFGMEHDTNECKCPEDRCIMAPSSSTVAPTHWSSCSLDYLLLAFTHGMDYCLKNKPQALFGGPVCGNGFVEPGEQCDCGLKEHCDNSCCDPITCMLYENASCATGECCDLKTCMPKTAGSLCRSAVYECDLPEYCTGHSEYCPADVYKMDTELCDNGRSFCYHGACRTRTDQCRLLWGETGSSSDEQCYKMNIKGTRHGNCGYNKFNQSFIKCNDENVLCGMLHCKHLNERLEFGMESVSILSHTFINLNGAIKACRTAIVDLGVNEMDPGLSPDGAKCGENKICVQQRCMPVDNLRVDRQCVNNCNDHGWCNNQGHCHCRDGYAPPFCENPGPGGSEDSGPASDPNAHKTFVNAMFIIFLGIIPSMALIALLLYYVKQNVISIPFVQRKHPSVGGGSHPKSPGQFSSPIDRPGASLLSPKHDDFHRSDVFFGHFKGFSLAPLKQVMEVPVRAAPPPPPSPPPVPAPPVLPPPNPGSTAKRLISPPILENSTCTAKELVSPLKHKAQPSAIVIQVARPAPPVPATSSAPRKLSLARIPSIFRSNTNSANSIQRRHVEKTDISLPIPQTEIDVGAPLSTQEAAKKVFRAQSMRDSVIVKRPQIPTFGSMRTKRPTSIPAQHRPRSPPPKPPVQQRPYDDCLNTTTTTTNIYAVIDEQKDQPSQLLSEIVQEIQTRNLDSIYSSTAKQQPVEYANQPQLPPTTESVYSNLSSSSSSSCYVVPNATPKPVAFSSVYNKPTQIVAPSTAIVKPLESKKTLQQAVGMEYSSPDLVTSCSASKQLNVDSSFVVPKSTEPDVLDTKLSTSNQATTLLAGIGTNLKKPIVASTKPTLIAASGKKATNGNKPLGLSGVRSKVDSGLGANRVVTGGRNVANLQKKFEQQN